MRQTARREIFEIIADHEVWAWIYDWDDAPHGHDCPYCWPDGAPPRAGVGWALMKG